MATGNPWDPEQVEWTIDGHTYTAGYGPGERMLMKTAREQGATRLELEAVHLVKALMPGGATVVNAEAS